MSDSLSEWGISSNMDSDKDRQSPGYNKWKTGDENLDWIQYQVGSKTNKSLKWDFTGCSERRTESKTIVRLMEVWIRIKPEEETKMLLQNTKVILRWIMWPSSSMEACSEPSIWSKLSKFWQKWFCNYNFLIFCLNSKDEIDEIRKKIFMSWPSRNQLFPVWLFFCKCDQYIKNHIERQSGGVVLHSLSVCYHRGGVDSVCHRVQLMT